MNHVFRIKTSNEVSIVIAFQQIKLSSLKTWPLVTKCMKYYNDLYQYCDVYIKTEHEINNCQS